MRQSFSHCQIPLYDYAMKLLISIYFFILAIIQMGLLFGVYSSYRTQALVRPNLYWMSSLTANVTGLLIFGGGILTLVDINNPEFNFTVANGLFYIAAVLQALFCLSLSKKISTNLKIAFGVSVVIFFIAFEYMRVHANFELRTIFMSSLATIVYGWQIFFLNKARKQTPSKQLLYLQYASSAEMFFALGRIVVLSTTLPIFQVEQIPQALILFTIAQLVMNTLSYIAIGGYWAEQIAVANVKTESENQEIKSLLQEREKLIHSLVRANKTSSTGALSASIAHELNQPLGASNLNIQYLLKKLADGQLSPVVEKEVLDSLLADNQRAANIIRTLRSVFADDKIETSSVDLGELIQAVLSITNPETISKEIQVVLKLDPNLVLITNRSEMQQVFLNLLNNAIQALASSKQDNKQIRIEGRKLNEGIELSFADNGEGVSKEAQTHLFELLSVSKSKGMGLGLWLCKHIVTRHGGSISFQANPGGGARFILLLPLQSYLCR